MLLDISDLITPEIFEVIYRMGHLDELVIADANYYASSLSSRVVYSNAPENHSLLEAILKYFPIDDDLENPINVMTPDHGYIHEPEIWKDYQEILDANTEGSVSINSICREDFYNRSRKAYATIQTMETRLYADIIIRKGVVIK